jgi:hypothetical protein
MLFTFCFYPTVCISMLRTPTFRRSRGRKAHTFWYQQTGHPDLLLRCCVHALDANTFAASWSRVRSNHELDPSMVHNFNALKTIFWFCLSSCAFCFRNHFVVCTLDPLPFFFVWLSLSIVVARASHGLRSRGPKDLVSDLGDRFVPLHCSWHGTGWKDWCWSTQQVN